MTQGVDGLGAVEALESVLAGGGECRLGRKTVDKQIARRLRDYDLAAGREGTQPRDANDGRARVAFVTQAGLAGVQRHPDAQICRGQRALRVQRRA
jgi:hypothetical protein